MDKLNYREGDIIYRQGQTYFCEIANERKAVFKAMSFGYLDGNVSSIAGCGGEGRVKCGQYFVINLDEPGCDYFTEKSKEGELLAKTGRYPIIGNYSRCRPVGFDMAKIKREYPELYKSIITREFQKITGGNTGYEVGDNVVYTWEFRAPEFSVPDIRVQTDVDKNVFPKAKKQARKKPAKITKKSTAKKKGRA